MFNKKDYKNLFENYFNALCAFSYGYVQEFHTAEDLVQEVFLELWKGKPEFKNETARRAFLYTATRNKSLNFLRNQAVAKKRQEALQLDLRVWSEYPVIEEETFNLLYREIKDLPAASQEVMLLALNGLKNPEIAEELNISVNTVKTQKKIAYAKLKTRIGPALHAFVMSL